MIVNGLANDNLFLQPSIYFPPFSLFLCGLIPGCVSWSRTARGCSVWSSSTPCQGLLHLYTRRSERVTHTPTDTDSHTDTHIHTI